MKIGDKVFHNGTAKVGHVIAINGPTYIVDFGKSDIKHCKAYELSLYSEVSEFKQYL